jgi:hypothetical protein
MRRTAMPEGENIDARTAYLLANKGFDPESVKELVMGVYISLNLD